MTAALALAGVLVVTWAVRDVVLQKHRDHVAALEASCAEAVVLNRQAIEALREATPVLGDLSAIDARVTRLEAGKALRR